jgi:signal transduction histidine kinase
MAARFLSLGRFGLVLWLVTGACASAQSADERDQPRILAIYSDSSTLTANIGVAEGLRSALDAVFEPRYELLTEFRGLQQFPGDAEDALFVDMLERKYGNGSLDAVLAIGPAALRLVQDHRGRFAPGTPVIAAGVTARSYDLPLSDDVHIVESFFDLDAAVALARRAQPDARRLVVFTGSAAFDDSWQRVARETLSGARGLDIEFVSGLTLSEFKHAAGRLDPDTILIILTIFEDAEGARFIPAAAAKAIAGVSAAPVWSVYRTFFDDSGLDKEAGVTGGVVEPFEVIGRTLGALTHDVIAGASSPGTIVPVPRTPVIDWDEMTRHGLDPAHLPDDAILLNYEATFWERYRWIILSAAAILLAQTMTIAALVVQGRRWKAAQADLVAQRLELARLSRVSQLGALSGAITHELNQPLTAILADAEAGAMLLRRSPPDIDTVTEILDDIAQQDRRAAKIISDLRALMGRGTLDRAPCDLNVVVRSVVDLTRSEALMRGLRVALRTAPRPLVVLGDASQLQQIVVNLMLNGMEAMANQTPATRSLSVETVAHNDRTCALIVHDSGPGLAREIAEDPFRPFATTKDGGLGMGLAICRTIAEAHNGSLAFETAERGARAVLTLPLDRAR